MEAALLSDLWAGLGGANGDTRHVGFTGAGSLPSVFAVTALASASIGAAGLAVAELIALHDGVWPTVTIDRRLASLWFGTSLRPDGWTISPAWDSVAGDYATADGWIRLHTNAPHHQAAALTVLRVAAEKQAVAKAVASWKADDLEAAIVSAGGCAATMRSCDAWAAHPQGRSVAAEPLLHRTTTQSGGPGPAASMNSRARPLRGLRVLDLTRVLAGPIATRFLAGFGADVLRIDPPWWNEPGVVPEVTLGKRCTRLDLRDPAQKRRLRDLFAQADVVVHGYRPDALARLDLGAEQRRSLRPGLVDISLDAYGWSGPWAGRRGFDSLVQMSTGIAEAGMRRLGRDRPTPLPVQALDHATGYLLAAAAIRGISERLRTGHGIEARTSLARMAAVLTAQPPGPTGEPIRPEEAADLAETIEQTAWGPARRIRSPVTIPGTPLSWDRGACALGSSEAAWA